MMNFWLYLIFIAALSLLAAVMLYARFTARPREKSSHHAPSKELCAPFPAPAGSAASRDARHAGGATSAPDPSEGGRGEASCESEPPQPQSAPPLRLRAGTKTAAAEGAAAAPGGYLDELQEAAAGLARLMRSSPVSAPEGRHSPAPAETAADGASGDATSSSEPAAAAPSPSPAETAAADRPAAASDASPEAEQPAETAAPAPALRVLLGEEVGERMDRIDSELNALEELVSSIESSLLELDAEDAAVARLDLVPGFEEPRVSEAA